MKLLVIEDDLEIGRSLERALRARGHQVRIVVAGLKGVEAAVEDAPDVIVLDLGLPDIDGLEILKMMRAVSAVPILVATARDDDAGVVRTLDAGADDYIVKPYSADQLEARIRAVMRRTSPAAAASVVVGELQIDPRARAATLAGDQLELTRKEFDLLAYLAKRAGTVVSKRELAAEVWGEVYGGNDKTVDVHLSWLRRKLGETAAQPRYLRVVRGVGVKVVDPAK